MLSIRPFGRLGTPITKVVKVNFRNAFESRHKRHDARSAVRAGSKAEARQRHSLSALRLIEQSIEAEIAQAKLVYRCGAECLRVPELNVVRLPVSVHAKARIKGCVARPVGTELVELIQVEIRRQKPETGVGIPSSAELVVVRSIAPALGYGRPTSTIRPLAGRMNGKRFAEIGLKAVGDSCALGSTHCVVVVQPRKIRLLHRVTAWPKLSGQYDAQVPARYHLTVVGSPWNPACWRSRREISTFQGLARSPVDYVESVLESAGFLDSQRRRRSCRA